MKKTAVFEYYPETVYIPLNLPGGTETKIEIVPGQAFGRGFHPTTKLCIKALENIFSKSGQERTINKVLDVGTGSGVLSISASLLGASEVTGLDIDNMIVTEACENVSINNQQSRVRISLASVEDIPEQFDLVMANVLTPSMLPMSEDLAQRVKPGGLALLSGIKDTESKSVIERFSSHGLKLLKEDIEREWVCLLLKK